MSTEYIWGCELNAKKKEYVWIVNDEMETEFTTSLLLKQATLGASVPDKEVNVVALESFGISDTFSQPLFRLTGGKSDQCQLDILITYPGSKLTLVQGSGPVHLWGQQVFETVDDASENEGINEGEEIVEEVDDEDDDDLDDDDEEEDGEEAEILKEELKLLNNDNAKVEAVQTVTQSPVKSNKRPAPSSNERSGKNSKKERRNAPALF